MDDFEFMPTAAIRSQRAWEMMGEHPSVRMPDEWIAAKAGVCFRTTAAMRAKERLFRIAGLKRPETWKEARKAR